MREVEATMPAIASLEDLKVALRRFRSMFLAVTPYASRFTTNVKKVRVGEISERKDK